MHRSSGGVAGSHLPPPFSCGGSLVESDTPVFIRCISEVAEPSHRLPFSRRLRIRPQRATIPSFIDRAE